MKSSNTIRGIYKTIRVFILNLKYFSLYEIHYYLKIKDRKINNKKIFRRWINKAVLLQKIKKRPQFDVEYAFYLLNNINKDKAIKLFNIIVKKVEAEERYKKYWYKSFEILADRNNKIEKTIKSLDNPAKKIFISGMGWSGSGAVFDYLREYSVFFPVEKEFSHLSRGVSIKTVIEKLNNDDYQNYIVDLFKYTLFSTGVPKTGEDARAVLNNIFINEEYSGLYAESNYLLLNNLYWLKKDNINEDNIREIVTDYLDLIIKSLVNNYKNFVLLNNVVTIQDLIFLNYIKDHYTLCTFRDPRATYVSKSYEKKIFDIDVDAFISEYKTKRKNFRKIVDGKLVNTGTVMEVQFEEFVLSDDLRKSIYRKLNDSNFNQKEFTCFKPWESEKNIDIYKDFPHQHRIREIEEKLPEYLWNK